jgi:hypothetical protein
VDARRGEFYAARIGLGKSRFGGRGAENAGWTATFLPKVADLIESRGEE